MNPLVGTWVGPDEYTAEVEYNVVELEDGLSVTATDPTDGESAHVSDVSFSDGQLRFTALWSSTGREARCVLTVQPGGEALLTFTYTDHARLRRKHVNEAGE